MKNLRFICAQPCITYYTWQVEVMINNFIKMGVNPNNIDILCAKQTDIIPDDWIKLAENYNFVRFFFYDDNRLTKKYTSSIRPNILKQHFFKNQELKNETIFYHDCDIAFTKPINKWITNDMIEDENWYGSDCRWYIGYDYIKSKGEDILDKMCEIIDIDKQIIKDNELNSIGAQYIMKGLDYDFWDRVERDSENLFTQITALNNIKKELKPDYHELQIWCADMWAVLWNGWKLGNQTICHKDLEFAWATSAEKDWFDMNIYHNAGVTSPNDGLFYKALYMNELPYDKELTIKTETANWHYWQEICETAKKSVLI